jgi:hypothetical protein
LSLSPQPLVSAIAATNIPIVNPDLSVRIIVIVPPPLQPRPVRPRRPLGTRASSA